MDRVSQLVLLEAIEECIDCGVSVYLSCSDTDPDPLDCSGYFDDEGKVLCVATGREDWFLTFIHEFNHFLQWKEDNKSFARRGAACEEFFQWADRELELGAGRLAEVVREAILLELDCERRAVTMICRKSIPIPLEEYIRVANSCLFLYQAAAKCRKWRGLPPYVIPEIVSKMPPILLPESSYLQELPADLERIYIEKCLSAVDR